MGKPLTIQRPNCLRPLRTAVLAVTLTPLIALGQAPDSVPPGARVRVLAPPGLWQPTVARVSAWRGDTLILDLASGDRRALPVAALHRLEVSQGTKSKLVTGAAVGLLAGTAATVGFLALFCDDPDTLCEADEFVRAFTIIALPPTVAGALVGLAVRVERWEPATVPGMRVSVGVKF